MEISVNRIIIMGAETNDQGRGEGGGGKDWISILQQL